jgi:diadenosine tetraphosphate (Ap4A) HIT family hydrolase
MFHIDDKIQTSSFNLGDWPLSTVLLKNEQAYPWFILVPRRDSVQEIFQLNHKDRAQLMEEINQLSQIVHNYFKPDKLNVGALGNIVSQLHVHVIARKQDDPLWPQGVWQSSQISNPYADAQLQHLLGNVGKLITASFT